jgi:hypothetical protein
VSSILLIRISVLAEQWYRMQQKQESGLTDMTKKVFAILGATFAGIRNQFSQISAERNRSWFKALSFPYFLID